MIDTITLVDDALTDGILLIRYLAGFRGAALTDGMAGLSSESAIQHITARLDRQVAEFDIDGDGQISALTDGILTIRYMAGFRGTSLVADSVGSQATRSATAITEFLQAHRQSPAVTDDFFMRTLEDEDDALLF